MPWSNQFINQLSSHSLTPIYELEIVRATYGVGAPTTIRSIRGALKIVNANVQGTSVTPQRWSVSFGGFDVNLVGDIRPYRNSLMRGCIGILRVRFVGGNEERIGIGQLESIRGQRGNFTAVFKDIISAFQSRIDYRSNSSFEYSQLFFETVTTTTVTTQFNPSDLSLVVNNSSLFNKSSEHNGLLYVTPSGGGNPFYMRWVSKNDSTNTFTLATGRADHPSTSGEVILPVGSTVLNAARINAAPHALFSQVILSTGAGTNGVRDVLPVSYGTAFPLQESFVDLADAQDTTNYIVGSGGTVYRFDFSTIAPLSNGFRGLMDIFATVGQWPVMRQNQFSWRGCHDPTGRFGTRPPAAAIITDRNIIRVNSIDFFDPSLKAVYMRSKMIYTVGGSSVVRTNNFSKSLPVAGEITRDFSLYYDTVLNEQSMAEGDRDRMAIWDFYNWSRISLTVTLPYAVLCAGDRVKISSNYLVDPYTVDNSVFTEREAMILQIGYNLGERVCELVLGIPPEF